MMSIGRCHPLRRFYLRRRRYPRLMPRAGVRPGGGATHMHLLTYGTSAAPHPHRRLARAQTKFRSAGEESGAEPPDFEWSVRATRDGSGNRRPQVPSPEAVRPRSTRAEAGAAAAGLEDRQRPCSRRLPRNRLRAVSDRHRLTALPASYRMSTLARTVASTKAVRWIARPRSTVLYRATPVLCDARPSVRGHVCAPSR